jgi:ABC-type multidrug transport system ATPase subunit
MIVLVKVKNERLICHYYLHGVAVAQLKNSLNCNLLIFDEVLDGSLDDVATESFLSILKGLDKGTNIFVISHKSKELLQDKFQDHITFIKRNNFSRIDT